MKVIRATALGMCFGVRDALKIVNEIENPSAVTIYGELVHNEEINIKLSHRGFHVLPETNRGNIPENQNVLITAHGISNKQRQKLLNTEKRLIDTTCPLVRYVHESAIQLQTEGYFIIMIGKPNHVEVMGVTGNLDHYTVVQKPEEVVTYNADKLGIICQSTAQPYEAFQIRREIENKNPRKKIRYIDTICQPTKDRQIAVRALIAQVEALVVVGGKHSNNTKQLVRLAEAHKMPVFHIQKAEDLNLALLKNIQTVGLTAGTSTLDKTVEEVYQLLRSLDYVTEKIHPVYAAG